MTFNSISPTTLYERILAGESVNLIDVRSLNEYDSVHAAGARCVPLDTLNMDAVSPKDDGTTQQPVYVICKSGARSRAACVRLVEQGLTNVVDVEGGTMAWQQAGLPVEGSVGTGHSNWLRISGLLAVALSFILGLTWNSAFLYVAVGIWLALVLTGNAPCCSSGACSTGKNQ